MSTWIGAQTPYGPRGLDWAHPVDYQFRVHVGCDCDGRWLMGLLGPNAKRMGLTEDVAERMVRAAAGHELSVHGRDGKFHVWIDGQRWDMASDQMTISVGSLTWKELPFKGFFEYKFEKLNTKDGGDEHLLVALGLRLGEKDEVWLSEVSDPEKNRTSHAYFVLVYSPEETDTRACKTTVMYGIKKNGGGATSITSWRWIKPTVKGGKIVGFEPVL